MLGLWGEAHGWMMEVRFGTNPLKRCYEDYAQGTRKWGDQIARRYVGRIDTLYAAKTLDELYTIPSLRLHKLGNNREGEWAITLQGQWRLILDDVSDNFVRVKEVSNHYDD